MRRLVLMAIVAGGVFYAPLPLIAQNGGGETPLIPVADMPDDSGGATAPSDAPLEVDPNEAPELLPPNQVNDGGGTEAPPAAAKPTAPAPEPAPVAAVAVPAPEPDPAPVVAQAPEEPDTPVETPDETPTETPTTPEPDQDESEPEEFEEEFDDGPEPGVPESPAVTAPQASAGPQLPRTGPEVPAIVLSGLSLMAAGMALRALVRERA